jgi:hypothetical protein
MTLMLVEENGVKAVEGAPGEPWLTRAEDASRIVEACLSYATRSALLYAENLSPRFFDLSSGEAGTVLQRLRNYRIRLAVVQTPDSPPFSSRFGEMVDEERRGPWFRIFENRQAARDWIRAARLAAKPSTSSSA